MGQQYENQNRACALQNRFTAYLQTALSRKKYDYIQKLARVKRYEMQPYFQDIRAEWGAISGKCQELDLLTKVKPGP